MRFAKLSAVTAGMMSAVGTVPHEPANSWVDNTFIPLLGVMLFLTRWKLSAAVSRQPYLWRPEGRLEVSGIASRQTNSVKTSSFDRIGLAGSGMGIDGGCSFHEFMGAFASDQGAPQL